MIRVSVVPLTNGRAIAQRVGGRVSDFMHCCHLKEFELWVNRTNRVFSIALARSA